MISEAIKTLQTSDATKDVQAAVIAALASDAAIVALPDTFTKHDLESYLPNRRRQVGTMTTDSVADFANYSKAHKSVGASVFVRSENLKATAVLNLGTPDAPGHADNRANLEMVPTAAYNELLRITSKPLKQSEVAEFIEDWKENILCADQDGQIIQVRHAVEAFRTITIEALRKMESKVEELQEESSVLDSIKASAKQKIPTRMVFTAQPYKDIKERKFELRAGILTGGPAPQITLRIIKLEDHKQQMADELAGLLREKFTDTDMPVLIGGYSKG